MACPSLLHSTFFGRSVLVPSPLYVRAPRNTGSVSVRADATPSTVVVDKADAALPTVVLVDKADAEKVGRLKTRYLETIVPLLKEEFKYTNIHQVPKLEKIVVNCGIGDAAQNSKGLDAAVNELALITGQRPVKTKAKISVAAFKVREGQPLGIAVTLRGNIMYAFLDRLINLGLPRSRDFLGVNPNSFDGYGNYSVGLRDQGVFPEIKYVPQGKGRGMDVCIKTTAKNDQEGYKLLQLMGMPFKEGTIGGGAASLLRKKKLKAHHFLAKSKGGGRR